MTTAVAADAIEGQLVVHEHRRIGVGLGVLREAISDAHRLTRTEAMDHVVRTLAWLRRDVLPHAGWEEAWLYPKLDQEAGTPWATRALRFEHEQIRELAVALESAFEAAEGRWTGEHASRITIAMTRLETLLSSHLAQEERFVLPLLHDDAEAHVSQLPAAH